MPLYYPNKYKITAILLLFLILLIAIFLLPISSTFVAKGVLSYNNDKYIIKHPEGGIAEKIYIKNNDEVKAGQDLIKLSLVKNLSDRNVLRWKILSLIINRQILEFEIKNFDQIALLEIDNQIKIILNNLTRDEKSEITYWLFSSQNYLKSSFAKYQAQLKIFNLKKQTLRKNLSTTLTKNKIIQNQIRVFDELVKKNMISNIALIDLQKQQIDIAQQIENYRHEIAIINKESAIFRHDNIIKIVQKIIELNLDLKINQEHIMVANDIFDKTVIKSPIDGYVNNLKIFEGNNLIQSGEAILEIIPKNPKLVIVAKIKNIDIDNVALDQQVEIFFQNYYEKNIPKYKGKIIEIAKDAIFDQELNGLYYAVIIKIVEKQEIFNLKNLSAGMSVDIFVNYRPRSLFSFLFAPLKKSMMKSFNDF